MVSEERSARRQRWYAVVLVIGGLMVVAAVTLWDHWRPPSHPRETSPAMGASHGASSGLEALFAALGIHRRTLTYRLGRAEKLLGRRFADPGLRAELWMAFTVRDR
jgi:formate hydrogenlyase subunit 3/multisubunit Na+/H+ antiporter MnhD subunit